MRPRMERMAASWRFALAAGCLAAGLSGCAGTPQRPVEVVYRFEGVRSGPDGDEWAMVRDVLQRHSTGPIREERKRRASIGGGAGGGGIEISDCRAVVTLPGFAAADAIRDELDQLSASSVGGSRIEFSLIDAAILYRGNTVAAGVQLHVAGFATQGFRVKLFPSPDAEVIVLTAGRNGLWNARLPVAPPDGWLYGLAEDPAGKVRTRYFRVNVSTQRQEEVDPDAFFRRFPQARPAVEPKPRG